MDTWTDVVRGMDTWTDVVNGAFDLLGEPTIANVDNDPPNTLAARAQRLYPHEANLILQQRRWPSAETAVVLAADADTFPGYRAVVTLPADCRRVNAVYAGDVASIDPAELRARRRVSWGRVTHDSAPGRIALQATGPFTVFYNRYAVPEVYGAALADLIAARLALKLTKPQSGSRSNQQDAKIWVKEAYRTAAAVAAAEGNPHDGIDGRPSNWLDAMRSGSF